MSAPEEKRILSISDDGGLGQSRQLLFENAGYISVTVDSTIPLSVSYVRSFDAAIVCQSLSRESAARLAERLRRYNPDIRILRICLMASETDACYDGICDSLAGPRRLLNAIGQILKRPQRETIP
jgi:hypothetical protein